MSVTTLHACRNEYGVHQYGAKMAEAANSNLRERNGGELPDDKVRVYLGFYHCPYETPKSLGLKLYFLRTRWKPENGQSEHFQIEAHAKSSEVAASKADYKREIRQIRNALFNKMSGPQLRPSKKGSHIFDLQKELPKATA